MRDRWTDGRTDGQTKLRVTTPKTALARAIKIYEIQMKYKLKWKTDEHKKLEKVAIIAMYCHLRPPDAIAFPV